MKHGSMVRFGRGDVLWSDGDPADWLGVVCVGTLKLTRPSEGTTDTMVDLVERGRMFGEEALVQGAQRPWTATVRRLGTTCNSQTVAH
jgi:CRP-like cAMP-binding protein